jgi:hypothetical protein
MRSSPSHPRRSNKPRRTGSIIGTGSLRSRTHLTNRELEEMFETSDECNRFRSGRFSNRAKLGFSASLTVPMWVRRTLIEEESGRLSRRLKEDLSKNPAKAAEEQTLKADNIKRLMARLISLRERPPTRRSSLLLQAFMTPC